MATARMPLAARTQARVGTHEEPLKPLVTPIEVDPFRGREAAHDVEARSERGGPDAELPSGGGLLDEVHVDEARVVGKRARRGGGGGGG